MHHIMHSTLCTIEIFDKTHIFIRMSNVLEEQMVMAFLSLFV